MALCLVALPAAADEVSTSDEVEIDTARLELTIETPAPNAVIGDPGGMAFVAGKALALFGEYQTFDIMFVIDTSESTAMPSGADIDGDGEIGKHKGGPLGVLGRILPFPLTDKDDTILAAEIAAAEGLLSQLDPRTTRVGVVAFSGDNDPMTPDAYTEVRLTTRYETVRKGLEELQDLGPDGMTNMVAGVNRAIAELLGTQSAYSEKREGARRIILFLTDGLPTLPFEQSRRLNARAAIERAKRAKRAKIRIDTFAIGDDALDEPISAVEMARVTGGIFTPVRNPSNLRTIFEDVTFAEIERLEIQNVTTDQPAAYAIQNADGSFAALVPMQEGMNKVRIFARSTDGTESTQELDLRFLASAEMETLSPRLVAQRNRLLENRLLDLQRRSLEIQEARDEGIRQELTVEIEQERAEVTQRAAEARRRLQIDVDD
jgi:hypothetical protein